MACSHATRMVLTVLAVLLTISLAVSKAIDNGDAPETFQRNQLENPADDSTLDTAIIRYLLRKEWLNKQMNGIEVDDHQRKRSYWKQCAFNAVSCFGKK